MDINVNIDIKEIFKLLCPECQEKVRDFTEKKVSKQASEDITKQILEGK